MVKGAAKHGSPGKKKKEAAAAEKVAETAVVRSANLSRPPAVAEAEEAHDEPNIVAELGEKIKQHFQGKKSWGPKEIRDRLVKFLRAEQVEDEPLVSYFHYLQTEEKEDSGASRNPFRKNLIEIITNLVVSILVCYLLLKFIFDTSNSAGFRSGSQIGRAHV